MGKKLTQAPVFYVLAQVKYNTLLALDSYLPQIQEAFRKAGFPDYQRGTLARLNLNLNNPTDGSGPVAVPIIQTPRVVLANFERTTAFLLEQNALSLETAEYTVFEDFANTFIRGLNMLNDAVGGLSFLDRIGIRYLDLVHPRQGEALSLYLTPSVLGLSEKIEGELEYGLSETRAKHRGLTLLSRVAVHISTGDVSFPPDLQPTVKVAGRFQNLKGLQAILDTDCWDDAREQFDAGKAHSKLVAVHSRISDSFKTTVSEHALAQWK
jgi:uncharacterized protein (TIGR04255 family)